MRVTDEFVEFPVPVSSLKKVMKKARQTGANAVIFRLDDDLNLEIRIGDMEGYVNETWQ